MYKINMCIKRVTFKTHKRRAIVQYMNFQEYDKSKSYFAHPSIYCSLVLNHVTSSCNKSKHRLRTSVLCGGTHPVNYPWCIVHKDVQKIYINNNKKNNTIVISKSTYVKTNSTVNQNRDPSNEQDTKQLLSLTQNHFLRTHKII